MSNKISTERKVIYYVGVCVAVFGFILFMSSFFVVMDTDFSMETPSFFKRAVIGMICMIVGTVLGGIGRSGAAGSGLLLNPEKAREDLKPYSESKGKMINDVVENIDIVKNISHPYEERQPIEVIKIKCRECGELNDEDAKFCKKCGKIM